MMPSCKWPIGGFLLTSWPLCWCTEQMRKKSFGNFTISLCKTWAIICYCFVHQLGRLIMWLKTIIFNYLCVGFIWIIYLFPKESNWITTNLHLDILFTCSISKFWIILWLYFYRIPMTTVQFSICLCIQCKFTRTSPLVLRFYSFLLKIRMPKQACGIPLSVAIARNDSSLILTVACCT